MSWIKDNKFLVALGGATLVGAVLLFLVGSKGADRYVAAKEQFDTAASEASNFEQLALYPRQENRDGKSKALDEYSKATESLQAAFEPFRPKDLANVSPQDFTNRLKAVNDEIHAAFADSATKLPDEFFCGFEKYKTSLARGETTGILNHQLLGIKSLMLALAGSGASELRNLHRPLLSEEEGRPFQAKPTDVARPLSLEITFRGPEKSLRGFLSSIVKPENHCVVVRSLRISNTKKDPPRAADAKFDKPAAAAPAVNDIFGGGGFVLPSDGTEKVEEKPGGAVAPAAPPPDSSRILAQVLGNEEVNVFLRLDLMQFLPAKKLP
ncbi:MAG: Amuc_1100 family pilus-like protein [Luteolibacter sp.]|jgi:hypothetical protein|nr:Amuc_1100 family pilus-like protein [Luteolibacter sp.]